MSSSMAELLLRDPDLTEDKRRCLTSWADIHQVVFGGNSRFTLVSTKTGARFTYRVTAKKYKTPEDQKALAKYGQSWFVSLLRGPDNGADYAYMGVMDNGGFHATKNSRVGREADSHKAFDFFLKRMRAGGRPCSTMQFWREGRCYRCGRALTVPHSIEVGLGPECEGRMAA